MEKAKIEVNANLHFLYKAPEEPHSGGYREYRRKWKENPETFTAGSFPLHLDIESTSLCNLRCPFCSFLTVHKGWERGNMEWGIYQRIIDEGKDRNLASIKLSLRGEPLIHPGIIKMIEYAKKSGIMDIYFNTNAVLLTGEMSERLIGSGLNRISISFEGTTKELYEKNRVGAKYEDVIKNIDTLISCRRRNKVVYPRIRIQTVLIPAMESRLDEYRDFWKEGGVDEVAYLDLEQEPLKGENLDYPWACPQFWQRMTIWYDGTIIPCVHDTFGLMKFGNVADLSIADLWKNRTETAYRNLHREGKGELLYPCKICPLRSGQVRRLKEKEAK